MTLTGHKTLVQMHSPFPGDKGYLYSNMATWKMDEMQYH